MENENGYTPVNPENEQYAPEASAPAVQAQQNFTETPAPEASAPEVQAQQSFAAEQPRPEYAQRPQFTPPYQPQPQFTPPYQPQAQPQPQPQPMRSEYRYDGAGLGQYSRETLGTQRTAQPWQNAAPQGQPYGGTPPFTPPATPVKKEKKEKKSGMSRAFAIILAVACVILSGIAGFAGAAGYHYVVGDTKHPTTGNGGETSTVISRTVETDNFTSSTGDSNTYIEVIAAVKDSVVEITTEYQITGFFQYVASGAGSGVIISEDGYVITNNHVIYSSENMKIADSITVRLTDGTEYEAKVVGRDSDEDIAVLKLDPKGAKLTAAVFGDSDKLAQGEEVIAIGNPLGELGGSVTNGIISALDRELTIDGSTMTLLQTNTAVNPGNSGGGLFNMKGELVGIVNAKSSGSDIEGLGFAIPANNAHDIAVQLIENGYVKGKPYIGVSFHEVTDRYTAYMYYGSQSLGVYVAQALEGYNENALKKGDRVVDIDGNEVTCYQDIKDIVKETKVGDKLTFSVYRDGKLTKVEVTVFEYVPDETSVDFEGDN